MASAWPEEDSFVCSVCLETLKEPTTLPCGHSYCLACIQHHWDKRDTNGQYSCPQCRQVFNPRPSLAKSTLLAEAMEKLRSNSLKRSSYEAASPDPPSVPIYMEVLSDIGPRKGSVYPQVPTLEPRPCPQHHRPLDLFCHEDRECVCEVCCQQGHKDHHVLRPQDERKERQKELLQMQVEVQRRIHESERMLKELPAAARHHKTLLQALEKESCDLFPELVKSLNQTGSGVGELLGSHEAAFCSQVEGLVQGLEQEVAQLRWKSEELSRLSDMQDHVTFLKNFLLMEPLGPMNLTAESVLSEEAAAVASIRSAIKELHDSVQDQCKATLVKIAKIVNQKPVALPPSGAAAAAPTLTGYSHQTTAQDAVVYESLPYPPPFPPARPQVCEPSRIGSSLNHESAMRQLSLPSAPLLPSRPQICEPSRIGSSLNHEGALRQLSLPSAPLLPSRPQMCEPSRIRGSLNHEASAPFAPLIPSRPQTATRAQNAAGLVNPEPKTREEMLKFRFEPTFDPNTVYRHMKLSDDNHKVTMRSENLNPPDHPERFVFWRQVLCREPLAGSPYYWEVEWTGQKITIGVAYKEMERKGSDNKSRLGHNAQSWSLYWSGTGFSFWHNDEEKLLGSPKAKRIGIYLDQYAGVLNFYSIVNKKAVLIHHHQTQFNGPLYPGFRLWGRTGETLTICRLD